MSEEEFFNRMINQISKVFDGRIANKMKNMYLKKEKKIEKALYWLSENTHYTDFNVDKLVLDENTNLKELLEILEEI